MNLIIPTEEQREETQSRINDGLKRYLIDEYDAHEGRFTATTEKGTPYVTFCTMEKKEGDDDMVYFTSLERAEDFFKKSIKEYSSSRKGQMMIRAWPKMIISSGLMSDSGLAHAPFYLYRIRARLVWE